MAKIISVINQKGGTGKTTVSANLAYLLQRNHKLKVLFVDLDKQGNGSSLFGVQNDKTIADLFFQEKQIEEIIQRSRYGVDVIAANMDLLVANINLIQNKNRKNVHTIFQKAIQKVKDQYDMILIDSPPDVNIPVLNILIVTNEVIMVATPDGFSRKGLVEMKKQLENIKKLNPKINYKGCVMNKFINTENTISCINKLKKVSPVFEQTLRFTRDRVDCANDSEKMVFEVSPNCGFAQDLKKFAKLIVKGDAKNG